MAEVSTRPVPLHSLTGLRFIAALLVLLFHAQQRTHDLPDYGRSPLSDGYLGVTFFFVLSGFILTWTSSRGDTAPRFWARRAFRIYPVHLLTLLIATMLLACGAAGFWGPVPSFPTQLLLVQSWAPSHVPPGFNSPSWSLSDEAFFYLLFPLWRPAGRRSLRFAAGLAIASWVWVVAGTTLVISAIPQWLGFLYWFPGINVGYFTLGIAAALAVRADWHPRLSPLFGAAAAIFCYLLSWKVAVAVGVDPSATWWFSQPLCSLGFAILI